MTPARTIPACLWIVAFFCLNGCGGQTFEQTYPVQGTITLDDQPLPSCTIVFMTPETGDLQSLNIEAGRFTGDVRPGVRRVEIRAFTADTVPRSPIDPPPGNYLPDRYNTASQLTATVVANGPNVFDYPLTTR